MENWDQHARHAYDLFDKDGNRPIMIEELASVCSLSPLCITFTMHVIEDIFYDMCWDALNLLFGAPYDKARSLALVASGATVVYALYVIYDFGLKV